MMSKASQPAATVVHRFCHLHPCVSPVCPPLHAQAPLPETVELRGAHCFRAYGLQLQQGHPLVVPGRGEPHGVAGGHLDLELVVRCAFASGGVVLLPWPGLNKVLLEERESVGCTLSAKCNSRRNTARRGSTCLDPFQGHSLRLSVRLRTHALWCLHAGVAAPAAPRCCWTPGGQRARAQQPSCSTGTARTCLWCLRCVGQQILRAQLLRDRCASTLQQARFHWPSAAAE